MGYDKGKDGRSSRSVRLDTYLVGDCFVEIYFNEGWKHPLRASFKHRVKYPDGNVGYHNSWRCKDLIHLERAIRQARESLEQSEAYFNGRRRRRWYSWLLKDK